MRVATKDDVSLRTLLERNAREDPDREFVTFSGGESWSRADCVHQMYRAADTLRSHGVGRGDNVAIALPNGASFLRAWWGAIALGAVVVPVNLALKGSSLEHLVRLSRPKAIVAGDSFPATPGVARIDPLALAHGDQEPPPEADLEIWDRHSLNLTSGTTGPSKLSVTTHHHLYFAGQGICGGWHLGPDDVFLIDLPLFHMAAMFNLAGSIATRTRLAVRERPALDDYWGVARDTGATTAVVLSSMIPYLMSRPAVPSEREHRLRLVIAAPLPADPQAFLERFGISDLTTMYGMTELPPCLGRLPGQPLVPGSCGLPRPGYEVRVVDEHDIEVPDGAPGEVVVRPDLPWTITAGYVDDPAATAGSWRNGWFHTGDVMHRDSDGVFHFVDRRTDSLRRRGNNISSFEVESEVLTYPGIAEAACVADRSGVDTDDEVKVWVVARAGCTIDFADLLAHLADRMPHFAVPRYFELTASLPKTASARVQKFELRRRGNSGATWDRQAHGFTVTRHGLVGSAG